MRLLWFGYHVVLWGNQQTWSRLIWRGNLLHNLFIQMYDIGKHCNIGKENVTKYIKTEWQCFIEISKHQEKRWKYVAQQSIFDKNWDVLILIADETLSQVFDMYSQSKQKPRSKQRSTIIKIYAYQDQVSKPPSWLWSSLF